MKNIFIILILLATGCFAQIALANQSIERACHVTKIPYNWAAYSPEAKLEAASINISSSKIVFAEKNIMSIEFISSNKPENGRFEDIYKITKISPRFSLSSVSNLCKNQSPGYVVLKSGLYAANDCSLSILPAQPFPINSQLICAHFNYINGPLPAKANSEFLKLLKH